jgi:two-component system, OmpR family, response regulator
MSAATHILVVDDDRETCLLLSKFLTRHGYRVSVAQDGKAMMQMLETSRVSLIVLDIMLPGEDGLSLCRRLRAVSTVPIIMLTAMAEQTDRVVGLEMGADDYLPKADDPRELLARIRAVLRRAGAPEAAGVAAADQVLEFSGWRLDVSRRQLFSPAQALIPLRASELELLLALVGRPQRVLTRDHLLDLARGRGANAFDRSIDVLISRLRRKLEADPKEPVLIRTIRGGGYVFSAAVTTVRGSS